MYRVLTASKDTYITNRIIDNSFRATDANVGRAGTLDLFKLYSESTISNESNPPELSRVLIKFDMTPARKMLADGEIDINHSSFLAHLNLYDVYGGQTTPSKFKLIVFPLAKNFDEGNGRDIIRYADLDSSNFVTASFTNGSNVLWSKPGAMHSGSLGNDGIDVIASGSLAGPSGTTVVSLSPDQLFEEGTENLKIDITKIISGTLSNQIADHGFLIAFSGSHEKDEKSYFVKRFGSRHVSKESLRPKITIKFNDSIHDNHNDFIFNVSGSLFFNNFHRGVPANILSGTSATQITGDDCVILTLKSGSYVKYITGSQHKVGTVSKTGVYSASFAISEYVNSAMYNEAVTAGSASFTEIWSSIDGSVGYHTGSLIIRSPFRTSFDGSPKRLLVNTISLTSRYRKTDKVKIRVFIEDRDREVVFKKLPRESKSQTYQNMYYQVRDAQTKTIVIPFDTTKNSTKLSSDSEGMYFHFYMDSLDSGRTYVFEYLITDFENDYYVKDTSAKFIVE